MLNLGCGAVIHPAWINCDIAPRASSITSIDFRKRLPFADETADVVYHSHVLEHLDREDGRRFLLENVRVLKRGGTLRVVVPDLATLCRQYLSALDAAERGSAGSDALYEFSQLDLLDQMVRRRSCGQLLGFVQSLELFDHPEIAARLTLDLQNYARATDRAAESGERRWLKRGLRGLRRSRELLAEGAVAMLAGRRAAQAFREGTFRRGGEVHLWMYDFRSLRLALEAAGLADVRLMSAHDSAIPDFETYQLDAIGSRVRRPGSLFVEARKP